MPTVDHSAIPNAGLHEPLDVDSATVGQVYKADGAASGDWTSPSYASMVANDGVLAVSSVGTTAQKLTTFNDTGPASSITPDATTDDDITVAESGSYLVMFSASIATAAAGDAGLYQFRLRINGSEPATPSNLGCQAALSGTDDTTTVGFSGLVSLSTSDILTIWVESDEAGDTDDIVVSELSLSVVKMGY